MKDTPKAQKPSYFTGPYAIATALKRDSFGSFAFSFYYFDDQGARDLGSDASL